MKEPKIINRQVPVLLENMYLINPQLNSIVKGIQSMARRKKLTVRMSSSFDEVTGWCRRAKLRAAIVLSYSKSDAADLARRFYERGIHPVFTNMQLEDTAYPYSCVTQNYRDACFCLVTEAAKNGAKKIAYVGNNPDSYTDQLRFREMMQALKENSLECDVYENSGNIKDCIESFLKRAGEYDAVICANDIIAVLLVRRVKDAERMNIMGFGGMEISERIGGFATVELDYFSVGSHAVELFALLSKESDIGNVTMTVNSRVAHGGERKESRGKDVKKEGERIDFYDDGEVLRTTALENLLLNCDDVDRSILRSLLRGEHYNIIEENSYISLNTIKYRIKNMIKNAGVSDKNELLELVRSYDIDLN